MEKKVRHKVPSILVIFWQGKKRSIRLSLILLWILITIGLIIGYFTNIVEFTSFSASTYLSVCISGLSFTFALFNISKGTFESQELKKLIQFEGKLSSGRKIKRGQLFYEYVSPFILTTALLAILGIISLLAPFFKINVNEKIISFLELSYLSFFTLAILSLLNLTYMAIEELASSTMRK